MAKSRSPKRSMSKRSKSPKASKSPKRSMSKRSKSPKGSKRTAYCLKCRKATKIVGCKLTKSSKGQPMVKGKCEKCGTKVNQFVKKSTKSC